MIKNNSYGRGYRIHTYHDNGITFYKVDEDGEEVKDKNGNTKLFTPKGRTKDEKYNLTLPLPKLSYIT